MEQDKKINFFWIFLGLLLVGAGYWLVSSGESSQKLGSNNITIKPEEANKQVLGGQSESPNFSVTNYPKITEQSQAQTFLVTQIVDGDTIILEDNREVRLLGIDTPEKGQFYFSEASNKTAELVLGKSVSLEYDVTKKDMYNRDLAHVWLGEKLINLELVGLGFAQIYTVPPNVKYVDVILEAQKNARNNNLGLWGNAELSKQIEGCKIKGNISVNQEKIYHMPGQMYYEKTTISEQKGEKWFCTELDALDNGFRKARK